MKRRLLFSLLTMALLLLGGVNVAVRAAVTEPKDPQATPLSISGEKYDVKFANWEALKEGVKTALKDDHMWYVNVDVWRDIDESFGDWNLYFSNTDGQYKKIVVLRLNGHKIKGDRINVNQKGMQFRIYDSTYDQSKVVYSPNDSYAVTNTNTGLLTLTYGVTASNKSRVVMESGCVKSEKNCAFIALGDQTQTGTFSSEVVIKRGYIESQESCVLAMGKGAKVTVDGKWTDEYSKSTDGVPVLASIDNAVVAGNGTNTKDEDGNTINYGGTTTTLGQGVFIGHIKTPGYAACGVYHPQEGTLNIGKDAYIVAVSDKTAAAGVVMRGGTLNMTGGTILAEGVADATGKVGDSRVVVPSSGIVFDSDAGYYDHANAKVNVTDGTVKGTHSAVELVNNDGLYTNGQVTLNGGTYSSDVAQFAAEGLGGVRTYNTETKSVDYTFAEGRKCMTIDADGVERYYNGFVLPLTLSSEGKTLRLLCDIEDILSEEGKSKQTTYILTKNTTIDLNGHKLGTSATAAYILGIENANVVIEDTKGEGVVEAPYSSTALFSLINNNDTHSTLTIKGGTFKANYSLFGVTNRANSGIQEINVLGGNFNLPSFVATYPNTLTHSLCGGNFTQNFYNKAEDRITNGYVWERTNDETYPWRIVSVVRATYGTTETGVEKDDNGRFVIDLKDNAEDANEHLTALTVAKDINGVDVTVRKNFAEANVWNSFYAPFALKVTDELLEKFAVAKIWDTELKWNGETPTVTIEFIKLKSGEEIPAFTPCIILAKEAGVQDINVNGVTIGNTKATRATIDCSTVEQKFTFTGVLANTGIQDKYAVANGTLLHATSEDATLSPFKFYMDITDRNASVAAYKPEMLSLRVIGDETTAINGIDETTTRNGNGKVYNLQGIEVGTSLQGLPAGIYMQNGRKFIVR